MVFAYSKDRNFVVINWKDKKHVLMLSTIVSITNQMGTCQHNTINKNKKHEKFTMPRPITVEDYCSKMFYMDRGYAAQ